MAGKKKTDTTDTNADGTDAKPMNKKEVRAQIVPKDTSAWKMLLQKAEKEHWRELEVTVQIREKLLAGKPAHLDAAEKMLAARGLEDQMKALPEDPAARAEAAAKVVLEGLCEFHRRGPDKPGIYFPTNHLKAGLKENWSVMGYRNAIRGSRGALAEGLFVYAVLPDGAPREDLDYIYLAPAPHGVYEAITHSMSPSGPIHALKRHEYVERVTFKFRMRIAQAVLDRIPDENIAGMLTHFQEHGMGACRSQGFGKWDLLDMRDVDMTLGTPKVPLSSVA